MINISLDLGLHQSADRIVYQRFIVDIYQLLRDNKRRRIESSSLSSSKNNTFIHAFLFFL